jgi:hypothetical protein
MTRDHVGFDPERLVSRILECCLAEHVSKLAAHDTETLERVLTDHVGDHGVPASVEVNGVLQPMRRCPAWPCRLCGLAFARFEIFWYFQNIAQAEWAEVRLIEAEDLPEGDPRRLRLEREAELLIRGLFSRPLLLENPNGRPSLVLANAVAQHLRSGGYPHSRIAKFMDVTIGAAEMRCRSADVRSVVPYHEPLAALAS